MVAEESWKILKKNFRSDVFNESFRSFKNFLIFLTRTIRTNLIDKENGTNKQLYFHF